MATYVVSTFLMGDIALGFLLSHFVDKTQNRKQAIYIAFAMVLISTLFIFCLNQDSDYWVIATFLLGGGLGS